MSDIRARLDAAPMRSVQVTAVALAAILSALDGYDVLSVTFVAPAIAADWGIGKAMLGIVLSSGLAGMALGSFAIAPFGDLVGRKKMILLSLALMAAGMLACALARSIETLALWRVVTGLGIGACVALINPISAEFANARRRPLTVSIMAVGYPIGGVAGGLLAAFLLRHHGWPSVFLGGFAAALILLPLVAWLLPESPAWLLSRRGPDSLSRINALLARLGHAPLDALPAPASDARNGYAAVFARGQIGATFWMVAINGFAVANIYYVLSWLPQMVADAGFAPSIASGVSAALSLAGIAGGLLLGWLAQHGRLRWLAGATLAGFGLSTIAFGAAPTSLPLLMAAAAICGFFLFAASAGVYAMLAGTFDDRARAAGTGFVIGTGRIVSAIAPMAAGALFARGLDRSALCSLFGTASILSAGILILGWQRFRRA